MKNYPSIGQVMFNWTPSFKIASQIVTDSAGKHWWEQEIAMDLDDLQMKGPHKAGDKLGIGLFSVVHNPAGWYWLDFPSASGHLEHYGFPRAVLTDAEPYVQVEEISGLHDEKLSFKSVIHNPSDKPVKVDASLLVEHGPKYKKQNGELDSPEEAFKEARTLEIPAHGSVRFDAAKDLPGLQSAAKGKGFVRVSLVRQGAGRSTRLPATSRAKTRHTPRPSSTRRPSGPISPSRRPRACSPSESTRSTPRLPPTPSRRPRPTR